MFDFHDISYANGQYDMDGDTSPVVFMKMSGFYYGSKNPYYDDQAARNYNNAIRLGKVTGLYHYAGGADPRLEADFFVGACSPLAEGDIYILDYELDSTMSPPEDPVAWCVAFVNRVHDRTGTWPLFYTNSSRLYDYDWSPVLVNCGLWVANYGVKPEDTVPTDLHPYIIHQYQGDPLDTNRSFVDLDTLKKYGHKTDQPLEPLPPTTSIPEPVTPAEPTTPTEPTVPALPTDPTTEPSAPTEPTPDPDDGVDWPTPEPDEPVVTTKDEWDKLVAISLRAFHTFWQTFTALFLVSITGLAEALLQVHNFSDLKALGLSLVVALGAAALSAVKNTIKTPKEAQ